MTFIVTIDDLRGAQVKSEEVLSFARWTVSHKGQVLVVKKSVNVDLSTDVQPDNVIQTFTGLSELNANWDKLIRK